MPSYFCLFYFIQLLIRNHIIIIIDYSYYVIKVNKNIYYYITFLSVDTHWTFAWMLASPILILSCSGFPLFPLHRWHFFHFYFLRKTLFSPKPKKEIDLISEMRRSDNKKTTQTEMQTRSATTIGKSIKVQVRIDHKPRKK